MSPRSRRIALDLAVLKSIAKRLWGPGDEMLSKVYDRIDRLQGRDYVWIANTLEAACSPRHSDEAVVLFSMFAVYCDCDTSELDAWADLTSMGFDSQSVGEFIWDMEDLFGVSIKEADVDRRTKFPYLSILHLLEIVQHVRARERG